MSDHKIISREDYDQLLRIIARITDPAGAPALAPVAVAAPVDQTTESAFTDYGAFYDFLRSNKMLGPKITAQEFEGCDLIIGACARDGWGISWIAYALATAFLETAGTMQPIKEHGGPTYFTKMYDIRGDRPAKARELGNTNPGDGAKYAGRGFVQITGKTNYAKASVKLREMGIIVDLVGSPDRAMEPAIAAAILVSGMREGWFTGRDIDDDLPATGPAALAQFAASRDVINGRDKQDTIAACAMDFQTGLLRGGYKGLQN